MASKQAVRLFNIGRTLKTWSIRVAKFFKHRVLSKRKHALIIGGDGSELNKLILAKLAKTWEIVQIQGQIRQETDADMESFDQETQTESIYQTQTIDEAVATQSIKSDVAQQQSNVNEIAQSESDKKELTQPEVKRDRFDLSADTPQVIESELQGKQFDAVIVLPDAVASQNYEFGDQNFPTTFVEGYEPKLLKTLMGYRLAHKYLTTSGVVILSCSQMDFLKQEVSAEARQSEGLRELQESELKSVSQYLLDSQISYLGVLIGDRDYTDLNSWSVIALSEEISRKDPETISEYYCKWADGLKLPMPGSFALFNRQKNSNKCSYIQYL